MVVFCAKMVVIAKKWLYLGKGGCIGGEVVVFGQKWFYLGKVVRIRAKVVCIPSKRGSI